MKSFKKVLLVGTGVLLLLGGLQAEIVDGVAVKVNEEIITISEIEEALAAYQQMERAGGVTRQMIIDRLVEKILVVQEARRRNITVSPDDVDAQADAEIDGLSKRLGGEEGLKQQLERENITFEELKRQYRQRVRRQMLYLRMMHKKEQEFKEQVTISEGEVAGFLKEHSGDYRSAEVAMIAFPLPPKTKGPARDRLETKARRVLRQLRAGGNFAKLAAENDPSATGNGGNIGRVRYAELPLELAELIFSLGKSERGKPVFRSGKASFYILRVTDVQEATLENSGDSARGRLINGKTQEKFDVWQRELREKTYVKIME